MDLGEICEVIIGVTPSRIDSELLLKHKFTSRIFEYVFNCETENSLPFETQPLFEQRFDLTLSTKGDLIVDLTSLRTIVVNKEVENFIVYQKYAIIKCRGIVNPYFLSWYINEKLYKKKKSFLQRSSVANIPISEIRTLKIDLPTKEVQYKIGNLYKLLLEKKKIEKRKIELENILILSSLNSMFEKE